MDINQDIKEVENFENHAHQWWNKRGPYKLIHNLTPLRLNYLENITEVKNTKILDIGCGGGLLSEELAKKGASVTGIDASGKTIKIAKNHAKESNLKIEYIHTTLDQYIKSSKKTSIKTNEKPVVNYSIAINISIELITGIGLGVFLGLLIDNYLQTKPLMLIICFILGTIIGFYNMYKALKRYKFFN